MKKIKEKDKLIICIVLTICVLSLSFIFTRSYIRIWESIKDFGLSAYFYFCELFGLKCNLIPTVTKVGNFDITHPELILNFFNFKAFGVYFEMVFTSMVNGETISNYFSDVLLFVANFSQILLLVMPLFLIFYIMFKKYFSYNGLSCDVDSKPLKLFKKMKETVYKPIKNYVLNFVNYLLNHRFFMLIWVCLFCLYFNFFTIIIEFFSFYFYFVMSFDFINISFQVYKLLLDLIPMFAFVPLIVWIVLGFVVFNKIREKMGYAILEHNEFKNRGFINDTGISTMICGEPGKGKTTMLTDMAISQSIMFRDKAFQMLMDRELMFPNFPFQKFENQLKEAFRKHKIYNLATARNYVATKIKRPSKLKQSFKYEDKLTHYDGLKEISIFEMLQEYAQLYLIYIIQSSLLISNYSIREDNVLSDLGNFPMWQTNLFKSNPQYMESYSRHAHILDQDMLRLGTKMVANNELSNAFEFGIVVITEIGKERGNMLDNKEIKKSDLIANPKNDGWNDWIKMVRHCATVGNFPFIKIICDEQRPESLGSDARELNEKIIHIVEKSEIKVPLMLFGIDEIIYDFVISKYTSLYYQYRYFRSDNTLLIYLFKNLVSRLNKRYMRLTNTFGFHILKIESERGTLDGDITKQKYVISHKKTYSKRFTTDSFSGFFRDKAILSNYGLDDIIEFKTERAMLEELMMENSYFIARLTNNLFK